MLDPRYWLTLALVATVYVLSGKLGLDLAFETSSVTAIWPPTGIALAAIVLGGPRLWPAVAIGALLTNMNTGVPAVTVLGITAGNTLEALVGAYLLRRLAAFRPSLERVRDVLALVGLGAVASTMVSASIGVASLLAGGEIDSGDLPSVWRTWWLGDMGGDLIVAPAIMIAATHLFPRLRRPHGRALEALVLAVVLLGLSVVVFTETTSFAYVLVALLAWAALRFSQLGASFASLAVAAVAVTLTANGHGPFSMSGPDERLLLAQTFVAVGGTTALLLAAVTSERRHAEETLREIASTLQDSLVPPLLPEVPRLETATLFRPAGRGQRVGGDFYDLFQAGDRSWVLTVGDVRGKGSQAAAMTALARYTLRAAAAREPRPSRVLRLLNEAVLSQHGGEDFCTVAYARLDLDGERARVTLSAGGHPLPLVLRCDGAVEELGRPGMLLGFDANPVLEDHAAELAAGDAMLFYTDGLVDAFAPERFLPVSELMELLEECRGRGSADIVAHLDERALTVDGREPRDDIAIVVLRVGSRDES